MPFLLRIKPNNIFYKNVVVDNIIQEGIFKIGDDNQDSMDYSPGEYSDSAKGGVGAWGARPDSFQPLIPPTAGQESAKVHEEKIHNRRVRGVPRPNIMKKPQS